MKPNTYLRILILGVLSTVLLSGISLVFLNRLSDIASSEHRNRFLVFFADTLQEKIQSLPSDSLSTNNLNTGHLDLDWELPPPPGDGRRGPPGGPGFPPPGGPPQGKTLFADPLRRGPRRGHLNFWLVNNNRHVLSANSDLPLPEKIKDLDLPGISREVRSKQDFFRFGRGLFVVRLDFNPAVFLVAEEKPKPFIFDLFSIQAALTFSTVAIAFLLSFLFTFVYLRKKSQQARAVLLRLEQGDLQARFELKRFDEFGALAVDFNRMAAEIEKLVTRIHHTEKARKNLIQELGHDLRTPVTSLTTSFETLKTHFDKMTAAERKDLFEMGEAEIKYFTELLEKLMLIAGLDEPSYKSSTESIDLKELLSLEVKNWQNSALDWKLHIAETSNAEAWKLIGDSHFVLRLIKNAFDNASRHARSQVKVSLEEQAQKIVIHVDDDGPGLTDEALGNFGKRREQRIRRATGSLQFSLGLGSVIMKTIAELHGGQVRIENRTQDQKIIGARLVIQLPKS